MSYRLKRPIDVTLALLGLILLAPVLAVIALLVLRSHGHPIIFRQIRPGLHGKLFVLYKFRTMDERSNAWGRPLPDEQRMTRLGHFLRASSLDELPELINVLKGEMSLVGPRPLLAQYLDFYTPEQSRRLDILPGITGWAQIGGRNAVSYADTFAMDIWYVDHQSLLLDLRIIAITIRKILQREGTMERKEMWEIDSPLTARDCKERQKRGNPSTTEFERPRNDREANP